MDALRIVERGDIAPRDLRGAWAGEIGQTQFMPLSYVKSAVDFDSNGRRDLLRSAPDVLASTAGAVTRGSAKSVRSQSRMADAKMRKQPHAK